MIETTSLTKTFTAGEGVVHALKDINLRIDAGAIYGIIGMSGAGKSTLVRCLNFLERPTSGEVVIDGKTLSSLTEAELRRERTEVSMIFQDFNLLMQRTVLDNVCFPMEITGVKKQEARMRAKALLEEVGLLEKAKAYPAQLSGGQQQRVAIARALANNPKILLCDEATSALDPKTTKSILALLKEINETRGITKSARMLPSSMKECWRNPERWKMCSRIRSRRRPDVLCCRNDPGRSMKCAPGAASGLCIPKIHHLNRSSATWYWRAMHP